MPSSPHNKPCPTCGKPLSPPFIDGDPWTHETAGAVFACGLVERSRFEAAQRAKGASR